MRKRPLRIHYVGLLKSPSSWAKVGREMTLALARLGCDISASSARGYLHDPKFELACKLKELIRRDENPDICLAFAYPPSYENLRGKRKIAFLVYESDLLPEHWVDPINSRIDMLIVPSSFCAGAAGASGVKKEKIRVVPYGYNAEYFKPRGESVAGAETFRFLFVGTPHKRKGLREAAEAFAAEFGEREKVELVIRTPYNPADNRRLFDWEYADVAGLIAEVKKAHPASAAIQLEVGILPDEKMPHLYRAADCFVCPSYSEGFGLSILEAMASGIPVIVTDRGGHRDFCNEENSYLIKSRPVPAGDFQYDSRRCDACVARPDVIHLRKLMRGVFEDRNDAFLKAEKALSDVRRLTWENAAKRLLAIIKEERDDSILISTRETSTDTSSPSGRISPG